MEQLQHSHEYITRQLANETSQRLIEADITFGVFSGTHAALLGGHRTTPDTDFWVRNGQEDVLIAAFPEAALLDRRFDRKPNDPYDGVLLTMGQQDEVGIMVGSIIYADGVTYPSPFTDLVVNHLRWQTLGNFTSWFVDPADTLLFKAISQRGRDIGKHDLDDMQAIIKATAIDKHYLMDRIEECHAWRRSAPLLLEMGILEPSDLEEWAIAPGRGQRSDSAPVAPHAAPPENQRLRPAR